MIYGWELIFLPRCDADAVDRACHECFDEREREAGVGEQGCVVVNGMAAYAVAVGEFALGVVLGDVDYQVDCVVANYIKHGETFFVGPANLGGFNSVFAEECGCAGCGVDGVATRVKESACFKHVNFGACVA